MKEKIEVSVYQHPTFEEGTILFQEDVLSALLKQCESVFLKTNPKNKYPREEVEQRFTQLLQAVSLEKSLHIKLMTSELPWEGLLDKLKRYYPQMVWTLGKKIDGLESNYSFEFIPLVENNEGFPFSTILSQSLVQQGIPAGDDPVEDWEQEVFYIVEDYLRTEMESTLTSDVSVDSIADDSVDVVASFGDDSYFDHSAILADVEPILATDVTMTVDANSLKEPYSNHSDEIFSDLDVVSEQATVRSVEPIMTTAVDEPELSAADRQLQLENEQLKNEQQRLMASNEKLQQEISSLNEQALMLQNTEAQDIASGNTMVLNKQALYYEEALRRERDAKERMRVTNEKLEHLVSRLERQVMESSLDIIEGEVPYVERSDDWYQKKNIDLLEYDQLYQKAKYLEHTWEVNQRLIVISERMTIGESEMKYERERVNRLKHSTKDIELFVMMDECRMINERVKIRPAFLWMKPHVTIMTGDYENLVEKAAYFDVIQSENQMLEKIIDEHIEEVERD